jgi:8-oxo-dGTP pyrophosphatase MutT (NUDIX family)
MTGPRLCTDIVDVYVFRRFGAAPASANVQFLQLRRSVGVMDGSWQPVMGHVEEDETATLAAGRELAEETGFGAQAGAVLGFWQLEGVNAYFLARENRIMLSPCFAAEVAADAVPVLDDSHSEHRWVRRDEADQRFMWPGQRSAVAEIVRDILPADSPVVERLRLDPVEPG